MAPNGDEKAFAVTGQSYRRLLEQTQLGDNGEHGPFCKSKTRGKGQLTCDDTEDKQGERSGERAGRQRRRERGEHGACQHQQAFKRASGRRSMHRRPQG